MTNKQKKVYEAIKEFIREHGYSPTYRDIGGMIGLTSKATVFQHIKALKDKGLITTNGTRSIRLVKNYNPEDIDKILKDNLSEYHYKIVKEYYGE